MMDQVYAIVESIIVWIDYFAPTPILRMKQELILRFEKLNFVPYTRLHVQNYHEWMTDPKLLEATASEPLTLEEEYENQISWANDKDKYTFILEVDSESVTGIKGIMIGDVNLFLHGESAEIEIMIADKEYQGLGYGFMGVQGMIFYGMKHLKIEHFTCKISFSNIASLKLFEKIGFVEKSRSDYFQEVELHFNATDSKSTSFYSLPIQEEIFREN